MVRRDGQRLAASRAISEAAQSMRPKQKAARRRLSVHVAEWFDQAAVR
jgi:formate dehydrogenase assembly factor FdhD